MPNQHRFPKRDADFNDYIQIAIPHLNTNFTRLVPLPATGPPPPPPDPRRVQLTELFAQWNFIYPQSQNPDAATATITGQKITFRGEIEDLLRDIFDDIPDSFLNDPDRQIFHLLRRDTVHTPAPIPTTTPNTDIKPGNGNQVVIFFSEGSNEPGASGTAKPEGVDRIEARYKIGAPAPATPADCPFNSESGRSPMRIDFTAAQAGQRLYLFFRWINTRNQPGPWTGTPESIVIPG